MTAIEQQDVANDYYVRAMQLIEDREAGLTEFYTEDEVFDLLYDVASDFYEWTLAIKDERKQQ